MYDYDEISKCAMVYEDVQQIPTVTSATILPGHKKNVLIHTNWQSQDFVKLEKNCFSREYALEKGSSKVLSAGFATESPHSNANTAFNKVGRLKAMVLEGKATDSLFIEIWNLSRKLITFDMTDREEHGKVMEADPFRCLQFSPDSKFLLYTAEAKRPKAVSCFKDLTYLKEENNKSVKGEEFIYRDEWGECCVDSHHSVLCILPIETGKVQVFEKEGVSIGEATWGPDNETIVFSAWSEEPYRLGIRSCRNRRSQICTYNFNSKHFECITPEDACAFSPRFSPDLSTVVYLENSIGGPHCKCVKLQKFDWEKKEVSTVVDIVNNVEENGFPGIYASSLPSRCWSSDQKYIYLNTNWRSNEVIISVNIENGSIEKLNIGEEFGCSSVLDVHQDLIVAVVSAPNIEPCLVAGFINKGTSKPNEWTFLDVDAPVRRPEITWSITKLQPKVPNDKYPNLDYEIIVVKPVEKKTNSLIIIPHGGPHVATIACFLSRVIGHAMLGYTLCLVNYRGSLGFGEDSVNSLPGNVGSQDVEDVHNAAVYLKDQEDLGITDVFVYGGSHGGFLGAHLIGQFPGFYSGAALLNPVINICDMIGVTDIPDWCWVEGGLGYDFQAGSAIDPERLKCMFDKSPIRYVENVKTPTLLLLGKKDLRVPTSQGYKYYKLLKARDVPVRLCHYSDNHSLLKTPNDGDVFVQSAMWFKKHSSSTNAINEKKESS